MSIYADGTKAAPCRCDYWSEAFDVAVERDRPVYCVVAFEPGGPHRGTAFPSRDWRDDPSARPAKVTP